MLYSEAMCRSFHQLWFLESACARVMPVAGSVCPPSCDGVAMLRSRRTVPPYAIHFFRCHHFEFCSKPKQHAGMCAVSSDGERCYLPSDDCPREGYSQWADCISVRSASSSACARAGDGAPVPACVALQRINLWCAAPTPVPACALLLACRCVALWFMSSGS